MSFVFNFDYLYYKGSLVPRKCDTNEHTFTKIWQFSLFNPKFLENIREKVYICIQKRNHQHTKWVKEYRHL